MRVVKCGRERAIANNCLNSFRLVSVVFRTVLVVFRNVLHVLRTV